MNTNKKLIVKSFEASRGKSGHEHFLDYIISNNIKKEDILTVNDVTEPYQQTFLYYYA
jgi:hypothetical protein